MPSTVIRALAYRPERRELEVLFTTGRRYVFHDVQPAVAEAFRAARIKGRHFNAHIRGRYAFAEVEPEAEETGLDRSSAR
ncbi:MAG: hypothetical protein JWN69_1196 [Alphaproteobacteria bacterium]|nr:hypothetical protein [Alphaproteobacteria bacterium]